MSGKHLREPRSGARPSRRRALAYRAVPPKMTPKMAPHVERGPWGGTAVGANWYRTHRRPGTCGLLVPATRRMD